MCHYLRICFLRVSSAHTVAEIIFKRGLEITIDTLMPIPMLSTVKGCIPPSSSKLKQKRWQRKREKRCQKIRYLMATPTPTRNMLAFMLSTSMLHIFSTHTPPYGTCFPFPSALRFALNFNSNMAFFFYFYLGLFRNGLRHRAFIAKSPNKQLKSGSATPTIPWQHTNRTSIC